MGYLHIFLSLAVKIQALSILKKALSIDYDLHVEFFNTFPGVKDNKNLLHLLTEYKNKLRMNFDLYLPQRASKPRTNGLTMMMDKGLSIRQVILLKMLMNLLIW